MAPAATSTAATDLDQLLRSLVARPSSEGVANHYSGDVGHLRLGNLRRYLEHVLALRPSIVVVGEAPGYRGSAVTGVPLTTRSLLRSDLGRWRLFVDCGFEAGETLGAPATEITATVVWRAAARWLARPPLTWNAFPFHPHRPGTMASNRSLSAADLREGEPYLRVFLELAPGTPVVAMGRLAARALETVGVQPIAQLRHPAHGGASAFTAGFEAMARDLPAGGV